MKTRYVLLIMACFLMSNFSAEAQKPSKRNSKSTVVKIKLHPEAAKILRDSKIDFIEVNDWGILGPKKNFKIEITSGDILIYKIGSPGVGSKGLTTDSRPLGGGMAFNCHGCEACKVIPGTDPDNPMLRCGGCGACNGTVSLPKGSATSYAVVGPDGEEEWNEF